MMTPQETGWQASITKDGPAKKFYLIKAHGKMLRDAGFDPKTMSCKEIEAAIAKVSA